MVSRIEPSYLCEVQKNTSKIRNFCILAHVDHGKTTLSDSLVSSNGIISAKLAGKLRYMDSTEEEQKRGITMHSSAISLLYDLEDRKKAKDDDVNETGTKDEYLINLVDSPGHIDFSSDVSTATRLCDGALIVVDVLEGICTQTHAVLYKALKERMRPCLVLNKIDRLLIDMRLNTVEAFQHLRRLVENVNALAFTLLNSEILKRNESAEALGNTAHIKSSSSGSNSNGDDDEDDPLMVEWTFSPEKGNVVFTGALDCWGFGLAKFVNLWSTELGVNRNILRKYLFEDYSFNPVTKKITRCDPSSGSEGSRPMFATMVLDPIWKIYELAIINNEPEKAAKMANKRFGIELPPREINARDPRATVQSIFRRWLPLSDAILRMVVRNMPSPVEAQRSRLFTLLPGVSEAESSGLEELAVDDVDENVSIEVELSLETIKHSMSVCDAAPTAPLVVFVSKMMPVRVAELSARDIALLNKQIEERALASGEEAVLLKPDGEVFMAMGRVYSGALRRDSDIFVIGHRHDPLLMGKSSDEQGVGIAEELDTELDIHGDVPLHMQSVVTKVPHGSVGMYIMLGPSVYPVEEVGAGNIVGIIGLEGFVLKTATLSNTWACHPMRAITFQAKPMVQVAVEPLSFSDLRRLENGLQSLYQFDPVVEIGIDDSGQNTIMCLGELHLEQCIKALTERFAKCEVKVSEPLIAFRETVTACESATQQTTLPPPWSDLPGLDLCAGGVSRLVMGAENLSVTFRCFPLPPNLTQLLERDVTLTARADATLSETQRSLARETETGLTHHMHKDVEQFWQSVVTSLEETVQESGDKSVDSGLYKSIGPSDEHSAALNLRDLLSRVVSIGPQKTTNNLLLLSPTAVIDIFPNKVPSTTRKGTVGTAFSKTDAVLSAAAFGDASNTSVGNISLKTQSDLFHKIWTRLSSSVVAGFQVTTAAGPLMHEPLHGVAFSVEKIEINRAVCCSSLTAAEVGSVFTTGTHSTDNVEGSVCDSEDSSGTSSTILTGQLISEVREALNLSMLACPLRVVEPVYQCDLQCDQMQVGNLYGVLSKRRGVVTKEDMIEGTSLFLLSAHLPVANSFGFAQELLKKTSGAGTAPQLSFSHWQTNSSDPFWRPKTDEELEEFGETANSAAEHNLTRTFIDGVRKRKGLAIEEKVVASAEKQRTLNKKK